MSKSSITFQTLADELVKASRIAAAEAAAPCLSCLDQMNLTYSSVGAQVLFENSVVAPLLKQAFAEALAELPWFAGRLVLRPDGRCYDLACSNAGARFLVGSTAATLDQAVAALPPGRQQGPAAAISLNPIGAYALPSQVDAIVKEQMPLCAVFLLHLSGGGALLAISAWHGMVDFEGLQTLVAHISTAYNTAFASRDGGDCSGGGCGGSDASASAVTAAAPAANSPAAAATSGTMETAAAASGPPAMTAAATPADQTASSRHGRRGFFAPAAVDALADVELPPGLEPRESMMALPGWQGPLVMLNTLYQVLVRGGGVEGRAMWIPPQRLAELKEAGNRQLRSGREEQQPPPLPPQSQQQQQGVRGGGGGDGCSNARGGEEQQGGGEGGSCAGGGGVQWVSTRDCLAARLAQLLHSLPLRRRRPTFFFVMADLRPRLSPPLPDSQLGNHSWGARVSDVRPSDMGLGQLAARVRTAISRNLPTQYCRHAAQLKQLTAVHPARQLVSELYIRTDPYECFLAPEGPLIFNDWRVRYDIWQFGPDPPLAFTPAYPGLSPNIVLTYNPPPPPPGAGPSGPAGPLDGGGLCLYPSLHRAVWRQLDRVTGGDLVAAL